MTKSRLQHIRIGVLAALSPILMLTGCGAFNDRPSPVPPPETSTSSVNTDAAGTPVAKTVIVYARGMDETEGTAKLLEAYNAQSETVIVKYQELATNSERRYQQLVASLAGATAEIDVFDADIIWPAEFAASGFVTSMDEYIVQSGLDMSGFFPGMVAAVTYQDTLWGLPKTASAGVLYYRTDMMSQPPATWSELLSLAEAQSFAPFGFVANGAANNGLVSIALEFIYAYGGRVLDEAGNVVIRTPSAVKGLEQMRALYTSSAVPPNMMEMTDNDACAMFLNGESAMMRNWPSAWALRTQADNSVSGKFAIAPLPAGDADSASVMSGAVIMMNAKTVKAEAVWDFMQFVTGKEGQAILAVHSGRVPALREVMQMPEVLVSNPHFCEQNFVRAIESAMPRAVTPFYTRIASVLQEELAGFLRFERGAPETAARIETRINQIFARQ